MGDAFLRFDFVAAVGEGLGEVFFRFGEAVGDGLGVDFFDERFRCLSVGAGVGVGAKIFLIFVPNESSAEFAALTAPKKIAKIRSHFMRMLAFKQAGALNEILNSESKAKTNRCSHYKDCPRGECHRVGW